MGRPKGSKNKNKHAEESSSTLKMVLKLSAQEHAQSQSPISPASSNADSDDDDDNNSRAGSKRSRSSAKGTPSKVARREEPAPVGITAQDFAPAERNLRDRYRAPSPKPHSNALQETLLYLQRLMERKDNNRFFAFPINDLIAPDYSSIVKSPMDFSTTKEKIDNKLYNNIMEYKADVKLICVNAMNYNHPETIYYKAAQRLLEYAMKTMSKERLLSMRKNQPAMSALSDMELALHLDVEASDYIAPTRTQKKQKDVNSYLTFEPVSDHLPVKDLIAIAKERAAEAAAKLQKKQPNTKMGFLRMAEDGTTTLNILNPDNDGVISEKERVITLGQKIGKLKRGLPYLDSIQCEDDEAERRRTIHYLNYGAFSSTAPSYDSSFSSLSKKESDLVLSYYGNQNGYDYIQSLRSFVSDGDSGLIKLVEDLANLWTANKHAEAQKILKDAQEKNRPTPAVPATSESSSTSGEASTSTPDKPKTPPVDFDALKSISDLGIDVSFLEHFKQQDKHQADLNKTGDKLTELNKLQSERLSQHPANLDKVKTIPEQEKTIASDLTTKLVDITKGVRPGDVTDSDKIREVLGVGMIPVSDQSSVSSTVLSDGDSKNNEKITQDDALVHSVPLGESPSEN